MEVRYPQLVDHASSKFTIGGLIHRKVGGNQLPIPSKCGSVRAFIAMHLAHSYDI
jgi:hypothetical protein